MDTQVRAFTFANKIRCLLCFSDRPIDVESGGHDERRWFVRDGSLCIRGVKFEAFDFRGFVSSFCDDDRILHVGVFLVGDFCPNS